MEEKVTKGLTDSGPTTILDDKFMSQLKNGVQRGLTD
jgi:hypothetical protein